MPVQRQKRQRPLGAGAALSGLVRTSLPRVMRVDPCNSRNVRAADADIGQFAVAEMRKLVHGGAVAPPSVKAAGNGFEHGLTPFLAIPSRNRR